MLVPAEKRRRVLGQLQADDDKQVMATAGVLLLAKVLADHGWLVNHEPDVDGVTPDLHVQKGTAEFYVEARHVPGDLGLPPAYQRVEAALKGIRTRTPATFHKMEVDPRASLRPFKAFLRRALDEKRPGLQVFQAPGIFISFELLLPGLDDEIGVFSGHVGDAIWFDDRPQIRAALDEKLRKYRFPLIIALHGIDAGDLFRAAEEELFGGVVYQIPISDETGRPAAPARLARASDSAVARRDSDGARVRARLEALLPFETLVTDRGFSVRARVLANPARPEVRGFEEFRPLPVLAHVGSGRMAYVGPHGEPVEDRDRVADEFVP